MEMGSSSLDIFGDSGSNESSSSSLHGLKFGKKIYFEDVGSGAAAAKPPSAPVKKGRGFGNGGQQKPPRCQVEGCKVDLTGAKTYYCRHKVCGMHSKSPKVVVNGMEQRFCQQCSRFHQLHEFDQGKRSCRRRLAGHNERRRKPPSGQLSSCYGNLSSSFHEDVGRYGGFVTNFTGFKQSNGVRDTWTTDPPVPNSSQWTHPSSRITVQTANSFSGVPTNGSLTANHDVQVGGCLGDVDSSCALSLLSNQPWTSASSSRELVISANIYGGAAQMAQSVSATSFLDSPWSGYKGHGASEGMHEILPGPGNGFTGEPITRQFAGELELALQGSRECSSSRNLIHWSL